MYLKIKEILLLTSTVLKQYLFSFNFDNIKDKNQDMQVERQVVFTSKQPNRPKLFKHAFLFNPLLSHSKQTKRFKN